MAKAFSPNKVKTQPVHFSDYYYRLEAKMKARYLRKLAYIKSEDRYVLNKSDLGKDVAISFTSSWVDIRAA